jgi:hypothetical protein
MEWKKGSERENKKEWRGGGKGNERENKKKGGEGEGVRGMIK